MSAYRNHQGVGLHCLLLGALVLPFFFACSTDDGDSGTEGDGGSSSSGSSDGSGGSSEGAGAQSSVGGSTSNSGGLSSSADGGSFASDGGTQSNDGAGGGSSDIELENEIADCERNVEVQCARLVECGLMAEKDAEKCTSMTTQCPAVFLMPGSGYSPGEIGPCADEWAEMTCEALIAGETPACARSGSRVLSEPCRYGRQCGSGYCSAENAATCGVCVEGQVASGGACEVNAQCPDGHRCSFGSCLIMNNGVDNLPEGTECEFDETCAGACARLEEGDFCVEAPGGGKECLPVPPAAGARRCAWPYHCGTDGRCMEPPDEGACEEGWLPCGGASYCDSADGFAPGQCVDELPLGSSCDPKVMNICGDNYRCTCDDASCESAHCAHYHASLEGSCGEYAHCGPGDECMNTECVPTGEPFWPEPCGPQP